MVVIRLVLTAILLAGSILTADREQQVAIKCACGGECRLRKEADQHRQHEGQRHRLDEPAAHASQPFEATLAHRTT